MAIPSWNLVAACLYFQPVTKVTNADFFLIQKKAKSLHCNSITCGTSVNINIIWTWATEVSCSTNQNIFSFPQKP